MKTKNRESGFTLIELLTVIVIIGVLTGLLTVSYFSVRQRGRDAQRKSDIKQIQSALELYRADNDTYPTSLNTGPGPYSYNCVSNVPLVNPAGTTTYMSKIPCDPTSTNGIYRYQQNSSTTYIIVACLDNTGDKDPLITSTSPIAGFTCTSGIYYTVANP